MGYTKEDIRNFLGVKGEVLKEWCYIFKEYLPSEQNRRPNSMREFSEDEVRIFIYIYYYWEDDPDIECIKIGLNREEYWEEPFLDFFNQIVPLFREIPENPEYLAESSFMLQGMAERTQFEIAKEYKKSADILVQEALGSSAIQPQDIGYSILFLYRHALELYLKEISGYVHEKGKGNGHDILSQVERLERKYNKNTSGWIRKKLEELNLWDADSMGFRYAGALGIENNDEVIVNLPQLKTVMDDIFQTFGFFIQNGGYQRDKLE